MKVVIESADKEPKIVNIENEVEVIVTVGKRSCHIINNGYTCGHCVVCLGNSPIFPTCIKAGNLKNVSTAFQLSTGSTSCWIAQSTMTCESFVSLK